MNDVTDQQIESIQSSGCRAAIVVTGGGVGAVNALMRHPGASRFVLEAQMPYSPDAIFDYLGEELDGYCSEEAAITLAGRAFERAVIFSLSSGSGIPVLGIACAAALQTNRERKGKDRAHLCIKSRHDQVVRELELPPGSREEQDDAVSEALLNLIHEVTCRGAA